jgi:hypothetical protein
MSGSRLAASDAVEYYAASAATTSWGACTGLHSITDSGQPLAQGVFTHHM